MITLLRQKRIGDRLHVVVSDSKDGHAAYYQVYITSPHGDWATFYSDLCYSSDTNAIEAFEEGVAACLSLRD